VTRFVVYGAGAVGGTIGARLFEAGHEVVLICRGRHLEAVRSEGLLFRTPEGERRLRIPAAGSPAEVVWRADDVVLLCMKTQDTAAALAELERAAGCRVPVVCAQNGVENERLAARRFTDVYAMLVALPATHLEPGVILASGAPLSGCLHAGRYPRGTDPLIRAVCGALDGAGFRSEAVDDALALKYRKLLLNLGNGLDVILGTSSWGAGGEVGDFLALLRAEGEACYQAAGSARFPPPNTPSVSPVITARYRSRAKAGPGVRRSRAYSGDTPSPKLTTSTARSSCSVRSMASPPRRTASSGNSRPGLLPLEATARTPPSATFGGCSPGASRHSHAAPVPKHLHSVAEQRVRCRRHPSRGPHE
jgi:2-dehydropantoate 2-reductase